MDRIGKYTIVERIGQGGMGAVYKARDPIIDRTVAIKIILERVLDVPEMKERFYREARSAGRLSHDNIVIIHDVGDERGLPYIVMEFLEGVDLRELMRSGGLSLEEKLLIALQICEGLRYAHDHHVVHRDIKPENVRILDGHRVKIVDFGIARIDSGTQTVTHSSLGTPRYMSPEQIKGLQIDHRTDIFSFGVVLYELLSGGCPFTGDHVTTVIYKILHEDPEPIRLEGTRLSGELEKLVSRCLEKSPDKRYQDFGAVAKDLRTVLSQQRSDATQTLSSRTLTAKLFGSPPAGRGEAPRRAAARRLSRGGRVTVAGILFVAILLGGYLTVRWIDEPESGTAPPVAAMAETGASAGEMEEEVLVGLREAALQEQTRMLEEQQRADGLAASDEASAVYEQGVTKKREGEAAFRRGDAAGYEEARSLFAAAQAHFSEAVLAASAGDVGALREQVERARQAMERARQDVSAQRDNPLIVEAISRAEQFSAAGRRHFEQEAFEPAIRSFSQAEQEYRGARRILQDEAARAALRADADQAKGDMEKALQAIYERRNEPAITAAFEQAETSRAAGLRAYEDGDFQAAAQSFEQARTRYEAIARTLADARPSELKNQADQARQALATALARVRPALRNLTEYQQALAFQQQGEQAYASGNYEQAAERYGQAEDLLARLSSPAVVVGAEARQVQDAVAKAITSQNWTTVPAPASTYYQKKVAQLRSSFVITDVNVYNGNLNVDDQRASATLPVTVNIRYRQKGSDLERTLAIESQWIWRTDQGALTFAEVQ